MMAGSGKRVKLDSPNISEESILTIRNNEVLEQNDAEIIDLSNEEISVRVLRF